MHEISNFKGNYPMLTSGKGVSFDRAFVLEQITRADDLLYPDENTASERRGPTGWAPTNEFDSELDRQSRRVGAEAQLLRKELVELSADIKAALTELEQVDVDATAEAKSLADQADTAGGLIDDLVEKEASPTATPTSRASS